MLTRFFFLTLSLAYASPTTLVVATSYPNGCNNGTGQAIPAGYKPNACITPPTPSANSLAPTPAPVSLMLTCSGSAATLNYYSGHTCSGQVLGVQTGACGAGTSASNGSTLACTSVPVSKILGIEVYSSGAPCDNPGAPIAEYYLITDECFAFGPYSFQFSLVNASFVDMSAWVSSQSCGGGVPNFTFPVSVGQLTGCSTGGRRALTDVTSIFGGSIMAKTGSAAISNGSCVMAWTGAVWAMGLAISSLVL